MYIVYWLFILLCSVSTVDSASQEKTTLVVKQNYNGPHEGWFHVKIYEGSPLASIDEISWCSTIFVPRVGEVPRDIKDCHASALLHVKIYPNGDPTLYRINKDDGTIEISPESVGGFWLNRPADLVIHGTLTDGRRLEQIVRLRPNPNEGDEMVEEKAAIPLSVVSPPKQTQHVESIPVESNPVESIPVEASPMEGNPTGEGDPLKDMPVATTNVSVTNIYAIVGGIGLLVMIFTIGMAVARRKTVHSMSTQGGEVSEKYASATVYAFENDTLGNVKKQQETDLLDALEQDNDSALKRRRKAENLEILTKMGKGATPSFYANI